MHFPFVLGKQEKEVKKSKNLEVGADLVRSTDGLTVPVLSESGKFRTDKLPCGTVRQNQRHCLLQLVSLAFPFSCRHVALVLQVLLIAVVVTVT